MAGPDDFELSMREIRMRKFRRMFDPILASAEEDLDESPRRVYLRRVSPLLSAQRASEKGKRPFSMTASWSLPSVAGRGRPSGPGNYTIPHTRNHVGGHQSDAGFADAVEADRYNRRQEQEAEGATLQGAEPAHQLEIQAIDGDRYLNRLEREANQIGLPSALRTNMDTNPTEREREWVARTRHERKAGQPRVNVKTEHDPELCKLIVADARWPEKLRIAIQKDLERQANGKGRPKAKTAGEPWIADDAEKVLGEIQAAYQIDPKASKPILSFGKPRAGRVVYKWEAELPRELDEHGRQRYLDGMEGALDDLDITYLLVMHRPDALNHSDNHHVHLLYSDRPVSRTGDGKFDIEKMFDRDYGRGRHATVHHRQNKNRAVTERDWTVKLRSVHVTECNRQLEESGAIGRYQLGSFADIGLPDETPHQKLGTKAARLEAAGVATQAGMHNAFVDWERADAKRKRKHLRRMERIAKLLAARRLDTTLDAHTLENWNAAATAGELARVAAEEIRDIMAMAMSRPLTTAEKSGAIASSYPPGSYESARWDHRRMEALVALDKIEQSLEPERAVLARLDEIEKTTFVEREELRRQIGGSSKSKSGGEVTKNAANASLESQAPSAHRFIDQNESCSLAVQESEGHFGYSLDALKLSQLSFSDFSSGPIQNRLAALYTRQQREIAAVAKLAQRSFKLDARSDTPHIRVLIARWREHPIVAGAVPGSKVENAENAKLEEQRCALRYHGRNVGD